MERGQSIIIFAVVLFILVLVLLWGAGLWQNDTLLNGLRAVNNVQFH